MAKIVIIGGGVAGLSAGIFAKINGHDAVVCEAHSVAGGNLTGWDRKGFRIDNCIHWLTGTNPNTDTYKLWQQVGALGNVEVYQGNVLYSYQQGDKKIDVCRDLDGLERQMLTLSPEDAKELKNMFNTIRFIQGSMGIAGKNHDQKYTLAQKIKGLPLLLKYFGLSTGELANRFKNPFITDTVRCFLGDDFSALAFIIVLANFCGDNGGIPKGSSVAMADRIVNKFKALGGTLLLNSKVDKIDLQQGVAKGVVLANGEYISADYVVPTCDPKTIFGKLLKEKMPKAFERRYNNPAMSRFSSYHCAFSCEVEKLDFEGDLIFELPQEQSKTLGSKYLILREFSHEKDFAPQGKSIIQSLTFCNEKQAKDFIELYKNKQEYRAKKEYLAQTIMGIIIEKMPYLQGKIECLDVWTPATYKRFTGSEIGSWMSFIFPKNTLPINVSAKVSKVKNVVLATQWLQSPGGLPIALAVGKKAIDIILKKERKLAKAQLKLKRKKIFAQT